MTYFCTNTNHSLCIRICTAQRTDIAADNYVKRTIAKVPSLPLGFPYLPNDLVSLCGENFEFLSLFFQSSFIKSIAATRKTRKLRAKKIQPSKPACTAPDSIISVTEAEQELKVRIRLQKFPQWILVGSA